jgi:hypothetical protein
MVDGVSIHTAEPPTNILDDPMVLDTPLSMTDSGVSIHTAEPSTDTHDDPEALDTYERPARQISVDEVHEDSVEEPELETTPTQRRTLETQSIHRNTAHSTGESGIQEEGTINTASYGVGALDTEVDREIVSGALNFDSDGSMMIYHTYTTGVLSLVFCCSVRNMIFC